MGGMAVVYFCHDSETGQPVALKTFKPEILHKRVDRLRFLQEVCDWIYLGAHPNIVQAYRVEALGYPAQPYLVLEAIPGNRLGDDVSLFHILESLPDKQLPIRSSLTIILQVIRAMAYANQQIDNFVHRDIKPANILIDPSGVARLTDFGVARSFDSSDNAARKWVADLTPEELEKFRPAGSAFYIAPEQWSPAGINADCRVDIYALGLVLYEMLVGVRRASASCLEAAKEMHVSGALKPMPKAMPEPISNLLAKATALNPDDRFSSWSEFESELRVCYQACLNEAAPVPLFFEHTEISIQDHFESYFTIAESYQSLGFIETAQTYNQRASELAHQLANDSSIYQALIQSANLYELQDVRSKALAQLEQASMLEEAKRDQSKALELAMLQGSLYARDQQPNQAKAKLDRALTLAQQSGDPGTKIAVQANIANAYAEAGQFSDAIELFKQQLSAFEDIGDKLNIAKCQANMSVAYLDMGDYDNAIEGLGASYQMALDSGDVFGQAHAMKNLGLAYKGLNDTKRASEWFQKYQAYVHEWQDANEYDWAKAELANLLAY